MTAPSLDEFLRWLNEAVEKTFVVGAAWGGIEKLDTDRALRIRLRRRNEEYYLNVSIIKIGDFPALMHRVVVRLRLKNGLILHMDNLRPSETNTNQFWAKLEYVLHGTELKLEFMFD